MHNTYILYELYVMPTVHTDTRNYLYTSSLLNVYLINSEVVTQSIPCYLIQGNGKCACSLPFVCTT